MPTKKAAASKMSVRPKMSADQLVALIAEQWKREVPEGYLPKIVDSLNLLSDDNIWWRPNDASNSLGNLVLHLCGNLSQWILAGLGGVEFVRKRDLEFSEKGPIPREQLLEKLRGTVRQTSRVIKGLSASDLVRSYGIQGYNVTGYEAAIHVTTHFAYHAGQIIYVAKMKRGEDLGFTKLPPLPVEKKLPAKRGANPLFPIKI
jgi:uncharacterized damage-inducible protein DinB